MRNRMNPIMYSLDVWRRFYLPTQGNCSAGGSERKLLGDKPIDMSNFLWQNFNLDSRSAVCGHLAVGVTQVLCQYVPWRCVPHHCKLSLCGGASYDAQPYDKYSKEL